MNYSKLLISFASAFLLCINLKADELYTCGTNCKYIIEDGVLTISPIDFSQSASIQSYIHCDDFDCYNDAPWYDSGVSKIIVSDGISSIGDGAFFRMHSVTSVELPEGLESIGNSSFEATNITNIDLPSTLTSLGVYAFAYSQLENINNIPEGITELPYRAFCNTQIENFTVPSTVTIVSPNAFGGEDDDHSSALIKNLYCSEAVADQCAAATQWKKDLGKEINIITYKKDGNKIFYKNHWYNNASDILSGDYNKKRIYTIDEANVVAGKTNTVSIRYR